MIRTSALFVTGATALRIGGNLTDTAMATEPNATAAEAIIHKMEDLAGLTHLMGSDCDTYTPPDTTTTAGKAQKIRCDISKLVTALEADAEKDLLKCDKPKENTLLCVQSKLKKQAATYVLHHLYIVKDVKVLKAEFQREFPEMADEALFNLLDQLASKIQNEDGEVDMDGAAEDVKAIVDQIAYGITGESSESTQKAVRHRMLAGVARFGAAR